MMIPPLSLRPIGPADDTFIFEVYASTRAEELQLFGWHEAAQQSFLRMQFEARRRSYAAQWPTAESSVVLAGDTPAGTMIVFRSPAEIRLLDLALLPPFRGQGYGTRLLQSFTQPENVPLRLSVAQGNRARRLYARLGFRVVSQDQMYVEMERS